VEDHREGTTIDGEVLDQSAQGGGARKCPRITTRAVAVRPAGENKTPLPYVRRSWKRRELQVLTVQGLFHPDLRLVS